MDPSAVPCRSWWCRASVLSAVLFAALLLNDSELIFHGRLYESGDYAANSLQIVRAKQFHETVGNYCRFGFHHPGPAFFYIFGWGECIFFDATHVVPTPFNGQLIALYALSAFFFGTTLAVIAARLGAAGRWFVGFALLFAAWHFGAVARYCAFVPDYRGFLVPWTPCFLILPFLCLMVTATSVAAGGGKDLPPMTLAASFLVHGHVAMPLFVVPLTLTAYGALWFENRRIGKPWNLFRRQHWLAAATIALFLLPIAIDLFTAHPSNLERIVQHLGTNYGGKKGLLESLFYFLHFGAYAAYPSRWSIPTFEAFDAKGLLSFFWLHWRAYVLWLVSVLLVGIATKSEAKRQLGHPAIRTFRRRMFLILTVTSGLSLLWGCLQEGPMYDYNALFNFAIYYGWLLILAVTGASWIENRLSQRPARAANSPAQFWAPRMQVAGPIALTLLAAIAFTLERRHFRGATDQEEQRSFAASVEKALILDPVEPKYFNFDWQANGETSRIALYLERRGVRWWVREDWPLVFGADRIVKEGKADQRVPTLSSSFWRVALRSTPPASEGDPSAIVLPLKSGFDLVIHPGK